MSNVTLTFFGGVNEIGGNKILLNDKDTKIFLDFGMNFSRSAVFFSEFLQPRMCNGLGDFFELGILPDLKGIYRRDYLKHMSRPPEDTDCQGVLLSHAHADHAAHIHFLREDIPIYCSEPTKAILKAVNDTSTGNYNDLTEIKTRFETYITKTGKISRKNARNHPDIVADRDFRPFEYCSKFKIDSIEIIPFRIDHSLQGATGYIIYTSSGIIVYTGDIRFHGRAEDKTTEFLDACKSEKPDVLIIEGTRANEDSSMKESDVEEEISTVTSASKGLNICNWPVRDTDRMMSFYNAAKKLDKTLTISHKQAYLLDLLSSCDDVKIPDIDDDAIETYSFRKSWGLIGSNWDKKLIDQDYESWERRYLNNSLCYKDIDDQNDFLFFCGNFDLKELIDIKPIKGSVYIKSVCEPFDIEMEVDWERINNWIQHFGMTVERTHVSGHASGPQLRHFIEKVDPEMVIPIHTEHATLYSSWHENTHLFKDSIETVTI